MCYQHTTTTPAPSNTPSQTDPAARRGATWRAPHQRAQALVLDQRFSLSCHTKRLSTCIKVLLPEPAMPRKMSTGVCRFSLAAVDGAEVGEGSADDASALRLSPGPAAAASSATLSMSPSSGCTAKRNMKIVTCQLFIHSFFSIFTLSLDSLLCSTAV